MDNNNRVNPIIGGYVLGIESIPMYQHSVTSLEGLYTDFDGWVARYNACYKRSPHFSKEMGRTAAKIDHRQTEDILEKDVLFGNSIMRHRHLRRTAKQMPYYINLSKQNDEFFFYDNVFYSLKNKNGVFQYIRSKL